jgi:hypothetical protein
MGFFVNQRVECGFAAPINKAHALSPSASTRKVDE